jgi:hypothetical protein
MRCPGFGQQATEGRGRAKPPAGVSHCSPSRAAATTANLPASGAGRPPSYERRRPEDGTLHKVVRENLKTLYAAVEDGFAGAPLPQFVRRDLEGYVDCGLLQRGFALIACRDCDERKLVAFACKSRAFCPSCLGRRMAQGAANLLDHVLPRVGLRQFVLTVPFPAPSPSCREFRVICD